MHWLEIHLQLPQRRSSYLQVSSKCISKLCLPKHWYTYKRFIRLIIAYTCIKFAYMYLDCCTSKWWSKKKKVFHFQPFSDCFQFRCKLYLCSIFWLALLYILKMYFVFVNILGHQFHGLRKIYCFEVRYFLGVSIKSAITILCLIIIWFRWSNQQQNPTIKRK